MDTVKEAMQVQLLTAAHDAALTMLPSEMRTKFVALYFVNDTILARREMVDGSCDGWVDAGALLGKKSGEKSEAADVDDAVERAIKALWPEADASTRRAMRIVANMAGKVGGLF